MMSRRRRRPFLFGRLGLGLLAFLPEPFRLLPLVEDLLSVLVVLCLKIIQDRGVVVLGGLPAELVTYHLLDLVGPVRLGLVLDRDLLDEGGSAEGVVLVRALDRDVLGHRVGLVVPGLDIEIPLAPLLHVLLHDVVGLFRFLKEFPLNVDRLNGYLARHLLVDEVLLADVLRVLVREGTVEHVRVIHHPLVGHLVSVLVEHVRDFLVLER
ncbi:MAG: hypothetical protein BWX71_02416 [Deltaproteobacteria bacterium ADurb.Bin072]|nr:MAG: hypothetical protein BWX71_02416 [Deltaproteobacteria bacterium ADurb.Bin072]